MVVALVNQNALLNVQKTAVSLAANQLVLLTQNQDNLAVSKNTFVNVNSQLTNTFILHTAVLQIVS